MAPRKITVVDANGSERKEMLGSQDGYEKLLDRFGVMFLVAEDGYETNDFESIVDGNKYTLGQQVRQQNDAGRPPSSPSPTRRANDSLPSDGIKRPKRPRPGEDLGPPSQEDKLPTGDPKSALQYVASEILSCSSSMIAMEVVALLETAIKEPVEKKYNDAAVYIIQARRALDQNSLAEEQVKKNERFFTGAFCDALNEVINDGFSVLHQGCIGEKSTHSDFSARYVLHRKCPTLMVGEGKANASSSIGLETRGQIFNELIRHRRIDEKLKFSDGYRPILLLALNFEVVTLDLAFPSKKGNLMEEKGWLTFSSNLEKDTETFWITPIAQVDIAMAAAANVLPKIIQFIVDTLRYLHRLDAELHPRQQFKTPFLTPPRETPINGEKRGDNVTIIETGSGKRVYKEFCYCLREQDGFNKCQEDEVIDRNQRKPPSPELLRALGEWEWYRNWKVEQGPFNVKILSYDFMEGTSWPSSRDAWRQVLEQVKMMHSLGYIHGDLLPRNLIFSENKGHVIDFDLTRKEDNFYTSGYNHANFVPYRPQANEKMEKVHDVFALTKMTTKFFEVDHPHVQPETVEDLIKFFSVTDVKARPNPDDVAKENTNEASGSPKEVSKGPARKLRLDS